LRLALAGPDNTEAREAARTLIARIVISPPTDPDDPPGIELIGDLANMLKAGGLQTKTSEEATRTGQVLSMFQSSVKGGPRALPLDPAKGGALRTPDFRILEERGPTLPVATPPSAPSPPRP
jgi:hypothetical protein